METPLVANLARITARLPQGVCLLAVSKGQGQKAVEEAIALGVKRFAENRVQEAEAKFTPALKEQNGLELHLIGPLQSNKAKAAVQLFDVIHTVDRASLVTALAAAMAATGRRPRLLVQVNIGREAQKAGVLPEGLAGLLAQCEVAGLTIEGLMCIPPAGQDPVPYFTQLAGLAREHGLAELSMGMSADYEQAIAAGATYIRVGTALFGGRG